MPHSTAYENRCVAWNSIGWMNTRRPPPLWPRCPIRFLQDIYPANRFRMRNRLISRTDIPVWSCYLKNHPTDRLAFLLDIFLCRSSADALDWATEQTTQDESYTMAAFCLHNDLSLPARLSMELPPPWPSRLAALNCVLKPNMDLEAFTAVLQKISNPLEASTPIPAMVETDYVG